MCGRLVQVHAVDLVGAVLHLHTMGRAAARYNVAPSQEVAVVRSRPEQGAAEVAPLRWGLIPSWAKGPEIGHRLINARAETAAQKPSFRTAFRRRRCLVPADGFYEWQRRDGAKQPYYIHPRDDGAAFAFASLWERWLDPAGGAIDSFTIVTTTANRLLAPLHDRMPVILPPESYTRWLDPALTDPTLLEPLLRPYPGEAMALHPVSPQVNSPRYHDPTCITPIAEPRT